MRISDWSSDVCSSDLHRHRPRARLRRHVGRLPQADPDRVRSDHRIRGFELLPVVLQLLRRGCRMSAPDTFAAGFEVPRSEEHTSELQSLMRISYAAFCLKKKIKIPHSLSHFIS